MDQVVRKPLIKHWSQTRAAARKRRLGWSLLLAVSSRLFLTLFIIGLGMYGVVSTVEQNAWLERQAEDARLSSAAVENYIQGTWSQLALLNQLGLAGGQSQAGSSEEQGKALQHLLRVEPGWLEVAYMDGQGNVQAGAYADQALLQIAATHGQAKWFKQAASGSPALEMTGGAAGLILAVPTGDGGVTAGRLSEQALKEQLQALKFGSSGFAYILNRADGAVVAMPDGKTAQPALYQKIVRRPGEAWNGQLDSPAGSVVQIATAPLHGTSWILVTEIPYREVTQAGRLIWQVNTAWLLLFWLLGSLVSITLFNRLVLQPLQDLLKGTQRILNGDHSFCMPVDRDDEIGDITRQINQMGAVLEERNHRLDKAREKAVLDSQFKSELLNRVDHNLRQPLGAILGFSEMLRDEILGPTTSQQRRALGDMINSTQRMSHMITDLLDSARLETQTLHLRMEEFSPAALLSQVTSQMMPRAERKGLSLTGDLDPRLPEMILGDVVRLQHILTSLMDNAIKFTQWGRVTVYFARATADQWEITVTDTGAGIPADACAEIFEPFAQVKQQGSRDAGGVGLGLSMVQQLVHLMDGQVRVESTVGIGSTFTVTLPLKPG